MKFYEYHSFIDNDLGKKLVAKFGIHDTYGWMQNKLLEEGNGFRANLAFSEREWWENSRPYYKAFPCIVEQLTKLKLDIEARHVPNPPFKSMVIRFAESSEIQTVFFSIWRHPETREIDRQLTLTACIGKVNTATGLQLRGDEPIESSLERSIVEAPDAQLKLKVENCIRAALTICLLADDPSIIAPDVLSADRDRYESETDEAWKERAVARARRRGVVGWNIGADYEVCPHYRRPHFGIRHTGKGGTVPRIVPIKGAVVHRSRLTEVPTGWMTPDGREVEPK